MKCSLIITPALIYYYISFIALCKICISRITVRYAEDIALSMKEVVPRLKQQSKAIQMQQSSASNKGWEQL